MRKILAIDPGPKASAYVIWNGERLSDHGNVPNEEYFEWRMRHWASVEFPDCYIEDMVGMGQIAGNESFKTSFVAGRFFERWEQHRGLKARMVSRKDIKRHFAAKNDAALYRYMRMRFGKKFFDGVGDHQRAAFALAVYVVDCRKIGVFD